MKIEVGKFYRTRSGLKARVYATDGANNYSIHGAVWERANWFFRLWRRDGLSSSHEGVDDLVDEWTEPKPKLRLWWNSEGHTSFNAILNKENYTFKGEIRAATADDAEKFLPYWHPLDLSDIEDHGA